MTQALSYGRNARHGLEVFLSDPDVAIETHQSFGASLNSDAHGKAQFVILMGRAGRQTHRHDAKPDRDVSAASGQSVRLSSRCVAAHWRPPQPSGLDAHAAIVEAALRRQPDAVGPVQLRQTTRKGHRVVTCAMTLDHCARVRCLVTRTTPASVIVDLLLSKWKSMLAPCVMPRYNATQLPVTLSFIISYS